MDQDRLDKIFKEGLENHKTPLDKDALWVAVSGDMPRSSRFLPLKLLTVLAVGIAIGFGLYKGEDSLSSNISMKSVENLNSRVEASNISDLTSSSPNSSSSSSSNENENGSSRKNDRNLKNENLNENLNGRNLDRTALNLTTSEMKTGNNNEDQFGEITFKGSESIQLNKIKETSTKTSAPYTSTLQNQVDDLNIKQAEITTIHKLQKVTIPDPDVAKNETIDEVFKTTITNRAQSNTVNALDILEVATFGESRLAPSLRKYSVRKVDCYEHGKKKNKIYGEFYSSIDFVKNHFSASEDYSEYLEKRDVTQKQLEAYRSGLRFKYAFRNGIYIKAGLEAGLIKERFYDEIITTETEIRPNQIIDIIENGDTTIIIRGDKEFEVERKQIWRVENIYKSLGVPVLIGYEKQIGKMRLGIDIGAIHNLIYDFDGYLSDNAGAPIDDPDFFKPSISTSLTGGFTIGYKWRKKSNLFAYTSFKHNLEEINNDLNVIQQKNTRIGLGIGIGYLLN